MLLRRSALTHGSASKLGRSLLTIVAQQTRLQHDGRTFKTSAGHRDSSGSAGVPPYDCYAQSVYVRLFSGQCHQQHAQLFDVADLHKETKHWYLDESITAGVGSKILKERLHALGAQSRSITASQLSTGHAITEQCNSHNTSREYML